MNKPIKGDAFRRGQYAQVMFQAQASAVPDMRISINEGSFWVNNNILVEYGGGQSPVIEAPATGAKWVLVAINKLGKVILYNGVPVPNNPEAPKVDKNVLPIAFVYVKSSSKVITNIVQRKTKTGKPFYNVFLQTPSENQRLTVWDRTYSNYRNIMEVNHIIKITGKVGYGGITVDTIEDAKANYN